MGMHRRRWLLLLVGLPLYTLLLTYASMALATIIVDPMDGWRECFREFSRVVFHGDFAEALDPLGEPFMWMYFVGPAMLVTVTQCLFLWPVVRPPRKGRTGHSLVLSFMMAGLVGAGLATGLFISFVQLVRMVIGESDDFIADTIWSWCSWLGVPLVVSWIIWSVAIASFARRQRSANVLRRMIGMLLGATLIEVLVVLPLDIMVRRRTNCYCGTATGHTLGFAAWAGLWLAGPGVVLAVMSKRRRLWWDTHCPSCGYEKGPSPAAQCPECGYDWQRQAAA